VHQAITFLIDSELLCPQGLIGDEPGPSSFLSAYMNSSTGSAAGIILFVIFLFNAIKDVAVKKSIVVDGEHQVLEISSCQWQKDTWLEIKNQTIKHSEG
jgi:hypothetical protein